MSHLAADEPAIWSLAEHLHFGAIALRQIDADPRNTDAQRICHHFWAGSESDEDFEATVSGGRFASLIPEFQKLDLLFETDRLEAWETVKPNKNWLSDRVPGLFNLVPSWGFAGYHGWTWEPDVGQPVGACEFQVINNLSRASDGRVAE